MQYKTYIISSTLTSKIYIGVTKQSLQARFNAHIRDARNKGHLCLHRAINKYGRDSFSISLEKDGMGKQEALSREVYLIKRMGSMTPHGYNMTSGGDGCIELCDESKKIKSKKAKDKHKDPAFKKKHSDGIKASFNEERKAFYSKLHKGKGMHPNAAKAIMTAKKTDAYKKIASAATKKTWKKDGYREKWVKSKLEKHIAKAKRFPMREDGLIFSSTRSAARYMQESGVLKAAPNNICLACNGKYKTSCGYSWSWIDGDKARRIGGII